MIKHNKNSVTVSNEDWDSLLEELDGLRESFRKEHLERCYMFHFIRYNNLQERYAAFKAKPPEDDPDDLPFDSYRN